MIFEKKLECMCVCEYETETERNKLLQGPVGCTFHVIVPQYPEAQAHALPGFLFEYAMLHSGFCVDAPTS